MLLTPNCIRRPRGGFSLAELMVVIVIIGLLATVVVPNLMLHFGTAQTTKAKADITAIAEAVKSFTILNGGMHPDSIEQLFMPDENGNRLMDRDTEPLDPWKHPYAYEEPEGTEPFLVWCYGKDGEVGGEGDNRDFNNRMIRNGEL